VYHNTVQCSAVQYSAAAVCWLAYMGSSGIMASVAFIALALILYRNLSSRYLRMGRKGFNEGGGMDGVMRGNRRIH
jgi:hypothetical protein